MEVHLPDHKRIGLIHGEVKVGLRWENVQRLGPSGFDAINYVGTTDAAAALWGRRRVTAEAHMRFNRRARRVDAEQMRRNLEAVRPVEGIDLVVAGHSVLDPPVPRAIANLLFIDTGAYNPKGRLTFAELQSRLYWQVGRNSGKPRAMNRAGRPLPPPLEVPKHWQVRD
jgi:hypothetical protein